jgi:hypothetical protein
LLFYPIRNIFIARFLKNWADAGVGEPGRTVNPLAEAFGGSNPSPPTVPELIPTVKGNIKNNLLPLFFCSFLS